MTYTFCREINSEYRRKFFGWCHYCDVIS